MRNDIGRADCFCEKEQASTGVLSHSVCVCLQGRQGVVRSLTDLNTDKSRTMPYCSAPPPLLGCPAHSGSSVTSICPENWFSLAENEDFQEQLRRVNESLLLPSEDLQEAFINYWTF